MSVYDPPTLPELQAILRRDLRDAAAEVFTDQQLTDMINEGITELNQTKPLEMKQTYTSAIPFESEALPFSSVFKVELVNTDTGGQNFIPHADPSMRWQSGWDYFGNTLSIGQLHGKIVDDELTAARCELVVWGYANRNPLLIEEDIFEGDFEDEALLRKFCRARGLRMLADDRALFQQWQTQANNSDVSPTQLTGMAEAAAAEWDRSRRRAYMIRRQPF